MGRLSIDKGRQFSARMDKEPNVVLELAATIVFLRDDENYGDAAVEETKGRKPLKATPAYLRKALKLLQDLGLESGTLSAIR